MFGQLATNEKLAVAVSSGALAALALVICLNLTIAPSYSDFIVGNITWDAGTKLQDLISVPIFIAVAFLSFVFFSHLLTKQKRQFGPNTASELTNQLMWWSLPAAAAIFTLILDSKVEPILFYISAAGIGFVGIATALNTVENANVSPKMLGISVFAVLLIALMPLELALVLGRLPLSMVSGINSFLYLKSTYAVLALGLGAGLFYAVRNPQRLSRLLPNLFLIGQVGLSTIYLTLYPARLLQPDGVLTEYETTVWLKILVVGMVLWGWGDVIRRFRKHSPSVDFAELLSPIAIFALLVGLKVGHTLSPNISPDDYHFGETLLGWWSYLHGEIPYVGYVPAHGLIDDYLTQFLSSIFYDGSAGSVVDAGRISFAFLSFLAFISIYYFSGSIGLAFVATFFLGGRLAWFFLTPFLCLWFSQTLRRSPSRWLTVWLFTAPIVILGVPAQGLLLVVSSGVMALYFFLRLWRYPEEREWTGILTSFTTLIILAFATPMGPMLLGAIRYIIENGPINQVAYGVPWALSWNAGAKTGIVFEVIRMSWLAIPLGCLAIIYAGAKNSATRKHTLLPAVVVLLFILLLIPYSMGRIDPDAMSRPGLAAIFGWTILLPIAAWRLLNSSSRVSLILLITCMSAALNYTSLSISSFVSATASNISTPPLRDGASVGLVNIGKASVQDEHWDRLSRLSRLLGTKLAPGETYLDLTSRNAQYFYLNRRPAIAVTAPYNMVPPSQQKLAVELLSDSLPDFALLEGANIIHDGGGLALRNPHLYRFVVDNYVPSFEDGFIVGYKKNIHAKNYQEAAIDLPVKNITDANWDQGFHRLEPAIVVDAPYIVPLIKVGDEVRLGNGELRRVKRVWIEGSALWFEGTWIAAMAEDHRNKIQWTANPQILAEYRTSLFQSAFSQSDFKKIPVAWGRSEKSLGKRMKLIQNFDGISPSLNQLKAENGGYKINGVDPSVGFDISSLSLSGHDAGLLRFDFSCVGKSTEPKMQIFWWGDDHQEPFEASSVRFSADNGVLIVPIDSSPRWLTLHHIKGIRIDLDNASACREVNINNVGLFQRIL